jgi:hypothetical protein
VVHRAGGQQRVHRQPLGGDAAVAQHQHHLAGLDRGERLVADRHQRVAQVAVGRVAEVDALVGVVGIGMVEQGMEAPLGEHRRLDDQPLGVRLGLLEQVLLGAEHRLQRHHDLLAQRIDRRVGDLRELLAERVVERAHAAGEHRQRGVVAHRADRFLAVLGQHADHLVTLFEGDLVLLLVGTQDLLVERLEHRALLVVGRLEHACVAAQPLLVGVALAEPVAYLLGVDQLAGGGVGGDHLARLETAVDDDVGRVVVVNADLRGQRDHAVAGDHVACRAQAVAVEDAGRVASVGHHDAGRAVPRLHVHRVVLVEGAHVGVHQVDVLPGRWDQQAHGAEDVHAAGEQPLEHVVEAVGVGAGHVDQRRDRRHVEQRRGELGTARQRPVAVALDGVDLAVVGEVAERLRQAPLRQGVGRKALVEHAQLRLEPLVLQVGVEDRQVGRHHQPLVRDHLRRQAGDVEGVIVPRERLFGLATGDEQRPLEGLLVELAGCVDEHLLDGRQRRQRLLAARRGVERHDAPAGHRELLRGERGVELGALRGDVGPGRVEHHADRVVAGKLEAGLGGHRAQEAVRLAHQQAAAVTGLAVGGHRTAVGHAGQGADRGADDVVADLAVHLCDEAETAAVVLERGPVETGILLVTCRFAHSRLPIAAPRCGLAARQPARRGLARRRVIP